MDRHVFTKKEIRYLPVHTLINRNSNKIMQALSVDEFFIIKIEIANTIISIDRITII